MTSGKNEMFMFFPKYMNHQLHFNMQRRRQHLFLGFRDKIQAVRKYSSSFPISMTFMRDCLFEFTSILYLRFIVPISKKLKSGIVLS